MTAWRKLHMWQQAGVWDRLHELLLAELHAADQIDGSERLLTRVICRRKKGPENGPRRSTEAVAAASTTCS
jgi:transposase